MKKPNRNIIGAGAIVRSLRKPRPKKPQMPALSIEIETEDKEDPKKGC